MQFHRLPWRIGVPFAAFVLAGSLAVIAWTWWSIESEERSAFEKLAQANAHFIKQMRLPATETLARQLGEVLGVGVFFRTHERFSPPLNDILAITTTLEFERLPADGHFHMTGGWESVAVPLGNGTDLMLTKPLVILPHTLRHPRTLAVLAAFWLLSISFAWLLTRGLVRPLRNLAGRIPEIEKAGPLDLPEVSRQDEVGDVARAFVRTRDALRNEREQRERAEKLAVLGRMTAALAHEIQNPVAAIKMHAQLAGSAVIEGEAARIENLVSQWMFLSRPQPPEMSDIELETLLAGCVAAHAARMDHAGVKPALQVAAGLMIRGDRRRLAQVFSNLLVNAIQAMPRGGPLEISAHSSAEGAVITFTDAGRGFSASALDHFAEFFYSEKEGGMGIGLSVASEIVKAHAGSLHAENRAGSGARLTVRLPAHAA